MEIRKTQNQPAFGMKAIRIDDSTRNLGSKVMITLKDSLEDIFLMGNDKQIASFSKKGVDAQLLFKLSEIEKEMYTPIKRTTIGKLWAKIFSPKSQQRLVEKYHYTDTIRQEDVNNDSLKGLIEKGVNKIEDQRLSDKTFDEITDILNKK